MDVPALVGVFNYFAGSGYHILGESSLNSPNFLNVSVRQPYGVVGLIIPWNVSTHSLVSPLLRTEGANEQEKMCLSASPPTS